MKYPKFNGQTISILGCLIGGLVIGPQPAFALPTLTTTPSSHASNLTLDGEGSASSRIVKVATLTASTANLTGFTLTVSSGSIGKSGGTSISFQVVTVDSGDPPPTAAEFTVSTGNNYEYTTNLAGSENRDLYIYYTPGTLQDPGGYDGSILINISDNPLI